jgi:hypothetical protein
MYQRGALWPYGEPQSAAWQMIHDSGLGRHQSYEPIMLSQDCTQLGEDWLQLRFLRRHRLGAEFPNSVFEGRDFHDQ